LVILPFMNRLLLPHLLRLGRLLKFGDTGDIAQLKKEKPLVQSENLGEGRCHLKLKQSVNVAVQDVTSGRQLELLPLKLTLSSRHPRLVLDEEKLVIVVHARTAGLKITIVTPSSMRSAQEILSTRVSGMLRVIRKDHKLKIKSRRPR